ncbi:hypothetical protein Tco_0999377, partial [Tanacetum coccineum]
KITWIAWEKVLASKKHGVLGVASLYALNRALLLKWVWRFLSQDGSLWSSVIKAIYGPTLDSHAVNFPSPWCSILREVKVLSSKGFNFLSHCKRRVGNGNTTRFWLDNWVLGDTLSERFPRLFALENNKQISIASKWGEPSLDSSFRRPIRGGVEQQQWSELLSFTGTISFSSLPDRWVCDLNGDGVFSVKDIRSRIDDLLLPSVDVERVFSSNKSLKSTRIDKLGATSLETCYKFHIVFFTSIGPCLYKFVFAIKEIVALQSFIAFDGLVKISSVEVGFIRLSHHVLYCGSKQKFKALISLFHE